MKVSRLLMAGALALGLISSGSYAAGLYSTYAPATPPLTGAETMPADTNLANGQSPQTEIITTSQLAAFTQGGTPGAATASAGAATFNGTKVKVTSEALTTAAAADYTLTLTDSSITAASFIDVEAANGTNTTEGLAVNRVQPAAGSAVIHIRNTHASAALNGTIVVSVFVY